MTPHHLHALAAAWSLQAARRTLAQLADDEAAQIAAEALEAPAVLRSTVYGGTFGKGGHSDPTPRMVAVADRPERRNRWAEMLGRLDEKLTWLAGQIRQPDTGVDPLYRLLGRLAWLQPGTAATLARHLQDEDRWVRDAVGLGPDRVPLPGVDCPACGTRALEVQTAGPEEAWTVVCTTGCRCRGVNDDPDHADQRCPCGMPGAVEGVAHIWPRAVVLGAVAGAAPTR